MNRVNNDSAQPRGLGTTSRHRLLGQLPKGVAILLGGFGGDTQGSLRGGVVRGQQDSAIGFHGEDAVARLEAPAIGHVFRNRGTHRTSGLSERHFLGHAVIVAYLGYEPASAGDVRKAEWNGLHLLMPSAFPRRLRGAVMVLAAMVAFGCGSEPLQLNTIQLGRGLNPDNTVAGSTTRFKPTDTIYAAVLTSNPGTRSEEHTSELQSLRH